MKVQSKGDSTYQDGHPLKMSLHFVLYYFVDQPGVFYFLPTLKELLYKMLVYRQQVEKTDWYS